MFSDTRLDAAVRAAIDKPVGDIYEEDLAGLFRIEAANAGIASLDGIEYCTQLKVLDLSGNAISDLRPLEGLQSLFSLDLSGNAIEDLSPLAGLASLSVLDLKDNQIFDVAALSQLPKLSYLLLDGNAIEDVAPLAANLSLSQGDIVSLFGNPLPLDACVFIDALSDRGAFVLHDLDCDSLPGEPPCPVAGLADIEGEAAATLMGEDWNTCDLDEDGIPDSHAVALASELLCRAENPLNAGLRAAYAMNLDALASEPLYEAAWADIKEAIVVFTLIGDSSVRHLAGRLSLANTYAPFVSNGIEVLGADGDPDGDGIVNRSEYDVVAADHGSMADYVMAALTPNDTGPGPGEGESEGEGEGEDVGPGAVSPGCYGIAPAACT